MFGSCFRMLAVILVSDCFFTHTGKCFLTASYAAITRIHISQFEEEEANQEAEKNRSCIWEREGEGGGRDAGVGWGGGGAE